MSEVPPQDPWNQQPGGQPPSQQPPSEDPGGAQAVGGYQPAPPPPPGGQWQQPGGYPPPPPPGQGYQQPGAYPPPPGAWQQGPSGAWQQPGLQQPDTSPYGPLAQWGPRVLGLLLDAVIVLVPFLVFYILGLAVSGFFFVPGYLLAIGAAVFFAVQLGQSGSTPGMRVIGLRCVGANTGQPIGAGMGVVRWIAHFVDSVICYVGWLFPLWDRQRQTLGDKIVGTVVVTVPKQGFSITPTS